MLCAWGGFGEYLGGKDSDTFEVFAAKEGASVHGNCGEMIYPIQTLALTESITAPFDST